LLRRHPRAESREIFGVTIRQISFILTISAYTHFEFLEYRRFSFSRFPMFAVLSVALGPTISRRRIRTFVADENLVFSNQVLDCGIDFRPGLDVGNIKSNIPRSGTESALCSVYIWHRAYCPDGAKYWQCG
jgi:hypothetical protein